jgi:hypothetical protein
MAAEVSEADPDRAARTFDASDPRQCRPIGCYMAADHLDR